LSQRLRFVKKAAKNLVTQGFKRQALHAERLDFVHPITHKKMTVLAPLPLDMKQLIDQLREMA
jgi:23S rRNA pseudouridine1911/1915/1917 synthase